MEKNSLLVSRRPAKMKSCWRKADFSRKKPVLAPGESNPHLCSPDSPPQHQTHLAEKKVYKNPRRPAILWIFSIAGGLTGYEKVLSWKTSRGQPSKPLLSWSCLNPLVVYSMPPILLARTRLRTWRTRSNPWTSSSPGWEWLGKRWVDFDNNLQGH